MNDNEKLIEEAFKAHEDAPSWQGDPIARDAAIRWHMRGFNDAVAVFEKAHSPTDEEVNALTKQFADRIFAAGVRSPQSTTAVIVFKEVVAGVRRSEVPEPSAAREFLKAALAESDADEAEGGAGWDVEVDARTVLGLLDETCEPQSEPSDAEADAAQRGYHAFTFGPEEVDVFLTPERLAKGRAAWKAALRAAGGAR